MIVHNIFSSLYSKFISSILPFGIFILFFAPPVSAGEHESNVEISGSVGWHSKYVFHGREDFRGEAMLTGDFAVSYHGFSAGVWQGQSDSNSNNETNFFIGADFEWDDISAGISYTYLTYGGRGIDPGESDDHDIALAVSCNTCLPMELTPEVGMVYTLEPNGYAAYFSLSRDVEAGDITISPYALIEYDHDYSSSRHDGVNYYEIGMATTFPVSDSLEVVAYASHVFAGPDMRREDADDTTWLGVSLGFTH